MPTVLQAEVPGTYTPPAGSPQARALDYVAARSVGSQVDPTLRVTLNFHPDRLHRGIPILRELAADGVYRSQFETGTSNGGLTAHPGGSRWQWESRIFGSAYDDAPPAERPKYGALNYRRRVTGGAPRFGSAHLRLRPEVLFRSTFCYPDSFFDPTHFGVASHMALIPLAEADDRDPLDDHIEAHVHGPLRLACDVEAIVLDPCFHGTEVESMARALPCPIEWHPGFRLQVDVLRRHPGYRGPEYVELGLALAQDGHITPAIIGDAARTGRYELQEIKKVWHYLARFGDRAAGPARG
ncbi:DUF3626 domain-containing protein [Sorangium sp. So ce291]|uniref:DUF3626 domain-containing protein n=1 Tax=Sorangium sp. So ce291 TaxID=3133294 RepID=UPI003F5E0300